MNLAIIRVLGIVLFLYLMWRNLKDDYQEESLISYSWISILSFFVGSRVAFGLINWGIWNNSLMDWFSVWNKPGMSVIGGVLAMLLVTYLFCKNEGWKLWSFLEDGLDIFLVFFGFLMLDEFVRSGFNMKTGFYILVIAVGLVVSNLVKTRYRSYAWYRSGKKGFTFLFVNFVICLILAGISFWFKDGIIYTVLYLLGSVTSFLGILILGEVSEQLMVNLKRKK